MLRKNLTCFFKKSVLLMNTIKIFLRVPRVRTTSVGKAREACASERHSQNPPKRLPTKTLAFCVESEATQISSVRLMPSKSRHLPRMFLAASVSARRNCSVSPPEPKIRQLW